MVWLRLLICMHLKGSWNYMGHALFVTLMDAGSGIVFIYFLAWADILDVQFFFIVGKDFIHSPNKDKQPCTHHIHSYVFMESQPPDKRNMQNSTQKGHLPCRDANQWPSCCGLRAPTTIPLYSLPIYDLQSDNKLAQEIEAGIPAGPSLCFPPRWKEQLKEFIVWPPVFHSVLVH